MDTGGVKGGAVEPPVAHTPRLGGTLGDDSKVGSRMPHVGQVPVGAARRDQAAEAPFVDGAPHLLNRLSRRSCHRTKRRVRLDNGGDPDIRNARKLAWAAPNHLFDALEPREAEAHVLALRATLVTVELAWIADVGVRGIEGEARDGSTAYEGDREERRGSGSLLRYARPVEGDGGVGGFGCVVGDAKVAGRGGGPFIHDECQDGRGRPARHTPQHVVGAQDALVAPAFAGDAVPHAHTPSADHGVDGLDQAGHE